MLFRFLLYLVLTLALLFGQALSASTRELSDLERKIFAAGELVTSKPVEAKRVLTSLLEIKDSLTNEQYFVVLRHLCFATLTLGEFEESKALSQVAIEHPNLSDYIIEHGYILTCNAYGKSVYSNLSDSLQTFDDALDLSLKAESETLRAVILQYRGGALLKSGALESALHNFRSAQVILNQLEGSKDEAQGVLVNIATIQKKLGNLSEAMESNNLAYNYFLKQNNDYLVATISHNQSSVLYSMENYFKAQQFAEESIAANQRLGDVKSEANSMLLLSDILFASKQYDSSIGVLTTLASESKFKNLQEERNMGAWRKLRALNSLNENKLVDEQMAVVSDEFFEGLALDEKVQLSLLLATITESRAEYEKSLKYYKRWTELILKKNDRTQSLSNMRLRTELEVQKLVDDILMLKSNTDRERLKLAIAIDRNKKIITISYTIAISLLASLILLYFLAKQKKQLKDLATYDSLTGVLNRRATLSFLQQRIALEERYSSNLTIALVDLDYFKRINDTFGHKVGDQVLKDFAHVFSSQLRKSDVLGRVGGEEFLVVFPNTSEYEAREVCSRAAELLSSHAKEAQGKTYPNDIGFSVGLASFSESNCLAEELIDTADKSLYVAKKAGRGRAVTASNNACYILGSDRNRC